MAILPSEAAQKRKAKASLERRAKHDAVMSAFHERQSHPLTRSVAYAICRSVYGGKCACEKREDLPACSTMAGAALIAVHLTARYKDPLPLIPPKT